MKISLIGFKNLNINSIDQDNKYIILRYDNLSDNHLRTAITIRITEKFPRESKDDSTRNRIKDSLLQIIKYSNTQVKLKIEDILT
jgi:hypothetical protein